MGRPLHSILTILVLLAGPVCYAQTSVKITDPRISIEGNVITISYDILNSSPEEKYSISISISDEEGNVISAQSLNGDVGEGVAGGYNKTITWDLEADNVFIDAEISIQINANIILPPPPFTPLAQEEEAIVNQDDPSQQAQQEEGKAESKTEPEAASTPLAKEYNRAGIIAQSIAFPGLGLSRVTGKPHWLRGVAGYGCLAGGIIMNRVALNTYDSIDDLDYFIESQDTYNKAVDQDRISQGLFFAAIGIWFVDIVWTVAGTADLNKSLTAERSKGFSIKGTIDPFSNAPMLSLNYSF